MVRVNCQNGDGGGSWVGDVGVSRDCTEARHCRASSPERFFPSPSLRLRNGRSLCTTFQEYSNSTNLPSQAFLLAHGWWIKIGQVRALVWVDLACHALSKAICYKSEKPFQSGGSFFTYSWSFFCLQVSFFAYSPLRPSLDALSHCKQKSSNCK